MLKKNIIFIFIIFSIIFISINNSKVIAKTDEVKKQTIKDIIKNENIVFLGDSITEYYPIDEIYDDLPIIKSGVAGYKTTDLLSRLDKMVYQYNPTSVYILIGTNDLMKVKEEDKEKTVNNIKKIVKKIKENRSKTKIYIESIIPINEKVDKKRYMVGGRDNEAIKDVNNRLKEYCEEKNYTYIDMYSELEDEDGRFSSKYTDDGLHPNNLGYAKMTKVLLTYIYDKK